MALIPLPSYEDGKYGRIFCARAIWRIGRRIAESVCGIAINLLFFADNRNGRSVRFCFRCANGFLSHNGLAPVICLMAEMAAMLFANRMK